MLNRSWILPALLLLAIAPALAGEEAEELLRAASLFGSGERIVARLDMVILEGGEEKRRELEFTIDRGGGRLRSVARILSPAFLSGMKFLKLSEPGQPDAQWLKTSKGLRRLSQANRSERVFGSHFTVEDFGSIDASGFAISMAPELEEAESRVIRARPKGAAPYAERLIRVERESGLILGMDLRDVAGKVVKRYSVLAFSSKGGERRPAEVLMEDYLLGGSTRLRILSLETPSSIAERIFYPGSL